MKFSVFLGRNFQTENRFLKNAKIRKTSADNNLILQFS